MQISVYVFHTGTVTVNKAIPYKSKNPLAPYGVFEPASARVTLPVSCYLARHPKGDVLFDTGWNTSLANSRYRRFCGAVDKMSHAQILPEDGVDSKLKALGVAPKDIFCVVFSHLDLDHVSGTSLVAEAQNFWVSKSELACG